jgi:hypothetical protein
MLHSVSAVGTGLKEKREKAEEKKKKKIKWGPFHYFCSVAAVLIAVMWGVIIFGGKQTPATSRANLSRDQVDRVLLFMVDGAVKRYAHYRGNVYPAQLVDLVPDYLDLEEGDTRVLNRLSYVRHANPKAGYELSLARVPPGKMKIVLTPNGIRYTEPEGGGSS